MKKETFIYLLRRFQEVLRDAVDIFDRGDVHFKKVNDAVDDLTKELNYVECDHPWHRNPALITPCPECGAGEGFKDIEVICGNVRVVLEWLGEGNDGDFRYDDPDDEPLLRYSVSRKYKIGERMDECFLTDPHNPVEEGDEWDGWRAVLDGSYCTELNANLPRATLKRMAQHILDTIEGHISSQMRCKRLMEELSWIDPTGKSFVKGKQNAKQT